MRFRVNKTSVLQALLGAQSVWVAALLVVCVPEGASGATIYSEDFESYPLGSDWADPAGTNGGWKIYPRVEPPPPDRGVIAGTQTFTGNRVGHMDPITTTHIWNRFNPTNGSNIPTPKAWIEFYTTSDYYPGEVQEQTWGLRVPKTNDVTKTRFQVGFWSDPSHFGASGTLLVSGALLDTTFSDFRIDDDKWAHIVVELEFNYNPSTPTSTAKVYAKEVVAGDTSPLTTDDILDLGGTDTVNFMWDGSIFDALVIQNDYREGTAVLVSMDDIQVHVGESPLVVKGDLNGDGFVGVDDLNLVLQNWNRGVPPGDARADPTGDGYVGVSDLNRVLVNWNKGIPPVVTAVIPEPASILLLGALGSSVLCQRE